MKHVKKKYCNLLTEAARVGAVTAAYPVCGFNVDKASRAVDTSLWRRAMTRQAASC